MTEVAVEVSERPWTSAEVIAESDDHEGSLGPRSKSSLERLVDGDIKFEHWSLTEIPEDPEQEEEYLTDKYGDDRCKSLEGWLNADGEKSDEYDTDLEDEIPEIKEASMLHVDPTGALYYSDICNRKGLRPVSFLFRNMKNRHIRMRHHYMTPDEAKLYTEALQRNTVTETLDLSDNCLGEEGTQSCCELLKDNMFILNLDLSMNFIGREGMESVVSMLESNSTLTTLVLSGNRLNDVDAELLGEALKGNHSISCLDVSHNQIGEMGGIKLAAGLVENRGVQDLDLSWNGIREKGAVAMVNMLKVNHILEVLDLSFNGLSSLGAEALGKVLKVNSTLKVLDISNNRIGSAAAQSLSLGLKSNTGLESLWLDSNPLGSLGLTALFKSLTVNQTLKLLSIEEVTLDIDMYVKVKEVQSERDITILHTGMGGYKISMANMSIMSLFIRYLDDNKRALEDIFNDLDRDRSGDITVSELKLGLKSHGLRMTNRQIDILMNELDLNNNATIEYNELLHGDLVGRSREMAFRRMTSEFSPEPHEIRRPMSVVIPADVEPKPEKNGKKGKSAKKGKKTKKKKK